MQSTALTKKAKRAKGKNVVSWGSFIHFKNVYLGIGLQPPDSPVLGNVVFFFFFA